jgi:phosphomannomutase
VVQDMVASENADAMSKLLETRLEFGTAGLRGKMAAGFNAMNDIVIIQTTQGFVSYLETLFTKDELSTKGVVVGYDGRHNSNR